MAGGERLMINAEEKEEEKPNEEQKLQIPLNESLPDEPNEALSPSSKAMMSYPLGRPFLSP